MNCTAYSRQTTKAEEQRGSGAQAAPASRRTSRAIRWVAVAAGAAAALAIPAGGAGAAAQAGAQTASHTSPGPRSEVASGGGYGSARTPQFPTPAPTSTGPRSEVASGGGYGYARTPQFPSMTQIAAHEGRPSANHQLVYASGFPTARQIAMHEGRLPENLPPTATAVAPSSDGNGNTLAIVLFSAALLAALGSVGFVVARRARVRPSA